MKKQSTEPQKQINLIVNPKSETSMNEIIRMGISSEAEATFKQDIQTSGVIRYRILEKQKRHSSDFKNITTSFTVIDNGCNLMHH